MIPQYSISYFEPNLKFKNLLDKHNDIELIIVEKCQILNINAFWNSAKMISYFSAPNSNHLNCDIISVVYDCNLRIRALY